MSTPTNGGATRVTRQRLLRATAARQHYAKDSAMPASGARGGAVAKICEPDCPPRRLYKKGARSRRSIMLWREQYLYKMSRARLPRALRHCMCATSSKARSPRPSPSKPPRHYYYATIRAAPAAACVMLRARGDMLLLRRERACAAAAPLAASRCCCLRRATICWRY